MNKLLHLLMFRSLSRRVGIYTRFYFFRLVNKKRSLRSLGNQYKDEYKDMGNALAQDFLNALVGTIVILVLVLLLIALVS